MDVIHGTVHTIVFTKEDTGFTVAKLHSPNHKDPVVIVGIVPALQAGESITCQGTWKKHAQHGLQFEVTSFESCMPADLVGIQKYLESGAIRGIGPSYAQKIISHFGLQTLSIIEENPQRLLEISGIGDKKLEKIISCWQEQRAVRKVMIFLRGHEVSAAYAQKIYKMYGDESIERVRNDPFSLTKEIFGIGFKTADKIASSLGFAKNSSSRIDAGMEYLFRELSSEGHTCYPKADFIVLAQEILEVDAITIEDRINVLVAENRLIQEENSLWVRFFYQAEQTIVQELQRIMSSPCALRPVQQDKALTWVEQQLHIALAPEQADAICAAMMHKVLIITGGPGTGKSTITKAILRICEKLSSRIILAAPTGRAAKRMSEITRKKAFTIHNILDMDFVTKKFRKNKETPLSADLCIIDEASMVDTLLMNHLLQAIPDSCRLILIGDVDQLPSVGAGNVLQDFIHSQKIPSCYLKKIFRQATKSKIITNAHRINRGYFPDLNTPEDSDFLFFSETESDHILSLVMSKTLEQERVRPRKVQVLSPMKRGPLGIDHLNDLLQQALNPSQHKITRMGRTFHIQDKVMQIRNNYQKEVYNGDIGYITAIDEEEGLIEVSFDTTPIIYDLTELEELTLAYAVSIHKYQGSECDCIILPIHTSHFKLLNKNLLYTAVTRGKKLVILIGSTKAIAIAVNTVGSHGRHTGLLKKLQCEHPLRDHISCS